MSDIGANSFLWFVVLTSAFFRSGWIVKLVMVYLALFSVSRF